MQPDHERIRMVTTRVIREDVIKQKTKVKVDN